MKILSLILLLFLNFIPDEVPIVSGKYDSFHIAYDPKTSKITGYFESYSGYDEATNSPRFSCVFYAEGKLIKNTVAIQTYYPLDKADVIPGKLTISNNRKFSIQLQEEHGGCWNVEHFKDGPVEFQLAEKQNWLQIRYITSAKSYFYTDKNETAKRKAYIVQGNIIYFKQGKIVYF